MEEIFRQISSGLRLLDFKEDAINKFKKEKSLEDIFLSNLFVNYFLCLITFTLFLIFGEFSFNQEAINTAIFLAFLLIYPFLYNILVYIVYGIFGFTAEVLEPKKHIKPLISIGYHISIIYSLFFFIIASIFLISPLLGKILLVIYFIYFFIHLFITISKVYNFSLPKTLIVVLAPLLTLSLFFLLISIFFPQILVALIIFLYA